MRVERGSRLTAAAIILFLNSGLAAAAAATCFWPDGSVAPKSTPCFPDQDESVCCEGTHACLSNKLCFDVEFNHVVRVACTDSSWDSASCPDYCISGYESELADIRECPNQNPQWICGQNTTACDSELADGDTFTLPFGLIDDTRSSTLTSVFIVSATPVTTTTSSASASATAATTTKSDSTASTTSSKTASGAVCTSEIANSDTVSGASKSSSSSGKEAAVGAGVGVPLFLAFVTALGLYLRERKLRRRDLRERDFAANNQLVYNDATAREYHDGTKSVELDDHTPRHELDAAYKR